MSDGGSHFKNEVIEKVHKLVGAHHHITTAYSPWANGTIEVVNRCVLRAVKTLSSEMKLQVDEWSLILPLVQGALNHQPASRLDGIAPVTAFMGLPASYVWIRTSNDKGNLDFDRLVDARVKHMKELRSALDSMHRDIAAHRAKLRGQARARRGKKLQVVLPLFSVGDFVLVGSVVSRPSKLALRWRGPAKIVRVITDYVMETQQLVPPYATSVHHACRLKMYHEGGREVTEDLAAHIAFGDGGFHVERLEKVRLMDG